jgi:hypothetical protein
MAVACRTPPRRNTLRTVRACRQLDVDQPGTGQILGTMRIGVAASRFAGHRSIVVRVTFTSADDGAVGERLHAFVRAGTLITEVAPSGVDVDVAVRLGVRAAARL